VAVIDGSYHEVDSNEMAFETAGAMGMREALTAAGSILLEPIMKVEVTTPEDYFGDVLGDISSRRGLVQGSETSANARVIRAFVPLSEMFGYATDVRSMTQGRAVYSMEFDHYEQVPSNIADEISKRKAS
jgi:elongation factor G